MLRAMLLRSLTLAAAFAASFAAGRYASRAPGAPEPAPPQEPAQAVAGIPARELPRDCAAREERVQAELDRMRAARDDAAVTLRLQIAARDAREGPPRPWTDDVDPKWRPDAFEAAVLHALEAVGAYGALELDCDEVPCLVAVTVDGPDAAGGAHPLEPLVEALEARGYEGANWTATLSPHPRRHGVLALLPEGAPEAMRTRVGTRMERMTKRRVEQLAEATE